MRFFFISFIVTLLTIAVWPWIKQFLMYLKVKYEEATDFEQEPEEPELEKTEADNVSPINAKKETDHDKDN